MRPSHALQLGKKMKQWQKAVSLASVLVSTLILGGCMGQSGSGSGEVSGPEDYKYKGKVDQLMSASADDRASKLSERFKLIQARQ